jgi:rhamnulokinase
MGLWLLQESLRCWDIELEPVLRAAAEVPAFTAVVDPDDPDFLAPGDMPARIARACRSTGQPAPETPAEFVRCILDSLALAHRRALRTAQELTGRQVETVHMVGGGARNDLLCQLTADACGVTVVAGPVEAAAFGNVLIQARALGAVAGDLPALRALLRRTQPVRRYPPRGDERAWRSAERRVWPEPG